VLVCLQQHGFFVKKIWTRSHTVSVYVCEEFSSLWHISQRSAFQICTHGRDGEPSPGNSVVIFIASSKNLKLELKSKKLLLFNTTVYKYLPHDIMLARYVPMLCVCLSVTSRCSTETAEHRIAQTMPHGSPGPLVTAQRSYASAVLGVVILSVRPSVCPSHACFVTNPKNLPAIFLYHMKGQSF